MSSVAVLRVVLVLLAGIAIVVVSLAMPGLVHWPGDGFVPRSFPTHTSMLVLAVTLALATGRGRLARFGFTPGSFRFSPRLLLWVLPMAVLSVLRFLGERFGPPGHGGSPLSPLQTILFVWVYASLCEEVLTRGLLQTWLMPLADRRVLRLGKQVLSLPVVVCALFFGAMHVVLWPRLGPAALVPMGLACVLGAVAGVHRERTGSLLPALLIHALFNVGGSVPYWLLSWLLPGR